MEKIGISSAGASLLRFNAIQGHKILIVGYRRLWDNSNLMLRIHQHVWTLNLVSHSNITILALTIFQIVCIAIVDLGLTRNYVHCSAV